MVGCVCVYLRAEVLLCKHLKVMRVVTRDERTAVGKEERGTMGKEGGLKGSSINTEQKENQQTGRGKCGMFTPTCMWTRLLIFRVPAAVIAAATLQLRTPCSKSSLKQNNNTPKLLLPPHFPLKTACLKLMQSLLFFPSFHRGFI